MSNLPASDCNHPQQIKGGDERATLGRKPQEERSFDTSPPEDVMLADGVTFSKELSVQTSAGRRMADREHVGQLMALGHTACGSRSTNPNDE